jgi:hypothetical protein
MTLASSNMARSGAGRPGLTFLGPGAKFAAAILLALGAATMPAMVPPTAVLPVIATLLFLTACVAALFGWLGGQGARAGGLTYWDVAGALTFIGICVAATIDPNQLVELAEPARRGN